MSATAELTVEQRRIFKRGEGGVHLIGELGRLFDPGARLRAHMQLDLAAVDIREEVLSEIGGKRE